MDKALVIIPTYNEAENIQKVITTTLAEDDFHVLVVDDSSPDGTAELVLKMMKTLPHRLFIEKRSKKEGLGKAYLHGFEWAIEKQYPYVFEMDADFSHDPKELPTMLSYLKSGFDMVVGSRYIKGINVVNWPLSRILLSYLASLYVRLITNMPVKDPTAGFVGYKREVLEQLDLKKIMFVGYAFQIEMKFKVWKRGFKLMEHPIIFTNRVLGASKMNGKIIWEALPAVILLRINSIFNRI
ncbi:MAG: polyprenol monophosphomannose synthase [Bacteroidetes bacterium]|nr:polyprenol monophosphomannose synthase [Bacteroidota bacterium]MDA0936367.1 polyprenol monophosphomannose synthase [Bacteroidota bacterium]